MSKEELIEASGEVVKVAGNGVYEIMLESGQKVRGRLTGKMSKYRIRIIPGDRVKMKLSPYDLSHGLITFRERE